MIRNFSDDEIHLHVLESESGSRWPVATVDDVFLDPGLVRQLGLSLNYRWSRGAYPGLEAAFSAENWTLREAAIRASVRILNHIGEGNIQRAESVSIRGGRLLPERKHWIEACAPRPEIFSAPAREIDFHSVALFNVLRPLTSFSSEKPHLDSVWTQKERFFSAFVYLNPNAQHGGTAFFRHRTSGVVALPIAQTKEFADLQRKLNVSAEEVVPALTFKAGGDENSWERVHTVQERFNRMVVLPGPTLHSISAQPTIATQLSDLRLTCSEFIKIWL
jgi:hypothetical protein